MQSPFIHVFATPGAYYVYDVNTNAIIKIDPDVYTYLKGIEKDNSQEKNYEDLKSELNPERATRVVDFIQKAKQRGFFSSKHSNKILHYADSIYTDLISSYMHQLILQITQNCNLRCEYCPYSGNYYNERSHSNIVMSEETVHKAIDFFLARTIDAPSIVLSFYGGEPLLMFELIKKAVEYFESKARGKEYTFSLTTNGTLFTEDNLRFFAEKNFDILISLDGPQHIHDQNRIFKSGGGSFERVMSGLHLAEKIFPEYIRHKVSINTVLNPDSNFCEINSFFTGYEAVKELTVMGDMVSSVNLKEGMDNRFDETKVHHFEEEVEYEIFKYYLAKSGRNIQYSTIIQEWEGKDLDDISEYRELRNGLPDQIHPSGPCVPGVQRLFVTADGRLYPCERVCEVGDVCCMGNLEDGIDETKSRTFLNIGQLTEKQCLNCWAGDFCMSCLTHSHDGQKLDKNARLAWCNEVKGMAEEKLVKYCVLNELGIQISDRWQVTEFGK